MRDTLGNQRVPLRLRKESGIRTRPGRRDHEPVKKMLRGGDGHVTQMDCPACYTKTTRSAVGRSMRVAHLCASAGSPRIARFTPPAPVAEVERDSENVLRRSCCLRS